MAWQDLANNQMPTFTDATSGATSGVFTLNSGQSNVTSNQCMTKLDAQTKYNLNASNLSTYANNQLVPKIDWVTGGWVASLINFNTSRNITSIGVNFATGGYVYVSPDGTRLYITSYADQRTSQYSLSIANDINSTITFVGIGPSLGYFHLNMRFSSDGTKAYAANTVGTSIFRQYTLSTAWAISTMSATAVFSGINIANNSVKDFSFNRDGTKLFVVYLDNTTSIYQTLLWNVLTPFVLSSISTGAGPINITSIMPVVTGGFYLEKIADKYYCVVGNGYNLVAAYKNGISNTDFQSYLPGSSTINSQIYFGPVCSNDIHIYSLSRNPSPPYVYTLNQYLTNL